MSPLTTGPAPTQADANAAAADAADAADAAAARARTDAAAGADCDSDRIHRAAEELLQRGRDGTGMTGTTARYRQLELAQLLHTIARAVQADDPLPQELVRHAANLSHHILNYPPAPRTARQDSPNTGPDSSRSPADGAADPTRSSA